MYKPIEDGEVLRREQCEELFNSTNMVRQYDLLEQTRVFQQLILFMDTYIRKDLRTFTMFAICGSERSKFMVDENFQNAFKTLNLQQKVAIYSKTVHYALENQNQDAPKPIASSLTLKPEESAQIKFRISYNNGFRSWKEAALTVVEYKVSSDDGLKIDLRNYLLRSSKNKEKSCLVLQAIQRSEPSSIRFSFLSTMERSQYISTIKKIIDRGYYETVALMIKVSYKKARPQGTMAGLVSMEGFSSIDGTKINQKVNLANNEKEKSNQVMFEKDIIQSVNVNGMEDAAVIQEIMKGAGEQDLSQQLEYIVEKNNEFARSKRSLEMYQKNVFKIMLPFYSLPDIDNFNRFSTLYSNSQKTIIIHGSNADPQLYKLELSLKLPLEVVLKGLQDVTAYKNWHPQIVQGQFKMHLSSQNSAIVYHKCRKYNQWYRERDFLYLRHLFQHNDRYYIVDKSIQNTNFIPFETIHRGTIHYQLASITPIGDSVHVTLELHIDNGGLLNQVQSREQVIKLLRGYEQFEPYFQNKQFQLRLQTKFDHSWKVKEVECETSVARVNNSLKTDLFIQDSCSEVDDNEIFFSINNLSDEQQPVDTIKTGSQQIASVKHEVEAVQVQQIRQSIKETQGKENIILDEEGIIVLPKKYLRHKNKIKVFENERKRVRRDFEDILLRDIWGRNEEGGFVLTNQKIIKAQDNVLKFIMGTLRNNIFSGKGILNISLPVTIFNCDSNLQRLCWGLSLAPQFVEMTAKQTNPVDRFKYMLAFGLTTSLLYIDVSKPFNPILGETYQGFIAGCPVYGEQISHHPPISAIYMVGRGYKVHAALESKVELHINSGDGINLGWYHVKFDDGEEVCFQTPPGQFSGLTIGNRKYQMVGKGYYFDQKNQLFCEMNFEDTSGFFAKNKWKMRDQIDGKILKVTSQFIQKFLSDFPNKKPSPSKNDILETYDQISGRWPFNIFYGNDLLYTVNEDLPFQMQDQLFPLNSNSNYRQDLYYRRMDDLSRSQSEKERLEIFQRGDRKLREKFHGPAH